MVVHIFDIITWIVFGVFFHQTTGLLHLAGLSKSIRYFILSVFHITCFVCFIYPGNYHVTTIFDNIIEFIKTIQIKL